MNPSKIKSARTSPGATSASFGSESITVSTGFLGIEVHIVQTVVDHQSAALLQIVN